MASSLPKMFHFGVRQLSCRKLSSATAFITRPHRHNYLLTYHTKLVLADGSSVTFRYHEPRQIITLPLDISTLSDEEAKLRLERRKPKTKVKIQDEEVSRFDPNRYIKLVKNKNKK
uniref:39S ribosomal protein L55, mitochondrial n=1 Tax=Lygus hesperus TaxID=30085 RepID=A0A0K8S6R8_LYGHE